MVEVNVKCSNGAKFTISCSAKQTVAELKTALEEQAGVPASQMRLIYRGQIMKDEKTLDTYCAAAPAAHQASPAAASQSPGPSNDPMGLTNAMGGPGMGAAGMPGHDPEMMREMMNSPMMNSFLNNPDLMRSVIQNNPQMQAIIEQNPELGHVLNDPAQTWMQAIIEQNPELGHVLNDPAVLRQTLEAARSPALMQEMVRTSDRFNMLRRMYHTVQEPLMDAAIPPPRAPEPPACDPSNPFADLFTAVGV
ncbi:hypothetical protein T484DRAFT_1827731 [Baffinella frigidus]|nr:hypothetical protein T484DRAFT_1827731 [Cryptophyta sp. CCMP2293]